MWLSACQLVVVQVFATQIWFLFKSPPDMFLHICKYHIKTLSTCFKTNTLTSAIIPNLTNAIQIRMHWNAFGAIVNCSIWILYAYTWVQLSEIVDGKHQHLPKYWVWQTFNLTECTMSFLMFLKMTVVQEENSPFLLNYEYNKIPQSC